MFNDNNDGYDGKAIAMLIIGGVLAVLMIMNGTKPVQQAAPSYNGNTWSTNIHIEDNDTNVCVGYCPDK